MCGENDDNGGAAGSSRRLPAVGAMRGPCGCEEKLKTTVVVVLSDDDDDDDYEEEFRRGMFEEALDSEKQLFGSQLLRIWKSYEIQLLQLLAS
ncbi:hypothetical protein OsI_39005 [Oryza sativa Indica Group]|uniref:Uncharacterized protein n=1 Tax=Oryza sativa subsp. indica TaxID=39946 RepID=B8BMR6_ORYSI|nr:hypothetical protein OsI_39005 [Oryza sativa Indica Group]